ncbi:MAG: SsrA-binding protein SmpB [Alphaproteobacteria bacterium]|nr:SsrA-binding protein SmpB [Alphaproteobacteria bacterium]
MAKRGAEDGRKVVAQNRRARHDYDIVDRIEAGIALTGSEVKSLRAGRCTLADAHAEPREGEVWLDNVTIPIYEPAGRFNHEPKRRRRLLLHKKEINRLMGAVQRDGMTVVVLSIYFNAGGRAKVELALAKGRKAHDRRQAIKDREWKRTQQRLMSAKR